MKLIALVLTVILSFSASAKDVCSHSIRHDRDLASLEVVATAMQYSVDELCSHPRVMDVYLADRIFYDPQNNNEPIPHTWVTIHYNEYSCQYFVRDADLVVTKKNCYNTW